MRLCFEVNIVFEITDLGIFPIIDTQSLEIVTKSHDYREARRQSGWMPRAARHLHHLLIHGTMPLKLTSRFYPSCRLSD
jgi:hypothetical protein